MGFTNTFLDFIVPESFDLRKLVIIDTSFYNPLQQITGNLIQLKVPGYINPVELSYNQSAVSIFNSNTLGISNVSDEELLLPLPDGPYIIKMSICNYENNWVEKIDYRTSQIEVKYDKALLRLNLSECATCFNSSMMSKLNTANVYIQGCKANSRTGNLKKAKELYNVANRLLDDLINCTNCKENTHGSGRQEFFVEA